MPVLNEQAILPRTLTALAWQDFHELVIVDGGSADGSQEIAATAAEANHRIRCIRSKPGRARQMNAGAASCAGDVLLFLHADTRLPDNAAEQIEKAISDSKSWGRFDLRLDAPEFMFRVIETMMNLRSRLTRICTGDQGIFVRRELFEQLGGYADIELMEDIELCKRLKRHSHPVALTAPVLASARRWQRNGVGRTVLWMAAARLLYWTGFPAQRLGMRYGNPRQ